MKDAYYFSHDSNAKDDPKCMLLIDQLGLEGYGIFWILIETLRDQPEYKYPIELIPILARRYNTSKEKMMAVVNKYTLFSVEDDKFFFSESLVERMQILESKRIKRSIAGKKGNLIRWKNNKTIANGSQCDGKASLSKVKNSKVNESKDIYYTQKKFYKTEYNNAIDLKKEYSSFINILFGKNEIDEILAPVLKIKNQLTHKQFIKTFALSKENGKSIPEIILSMHNKPKTINGNTSLYMTLRNWLKFKK